MRRVRTTGVLLGICGALLLGASTAGAASPRQIYHDYVQHGRLTHHYSKSDLQRALQSTLLKGYTHGHGPGMKTHIRIHFPPRTIQASPSSAAPCSTSTHSSMSIEPGNNCPGPGDPFSRSATRRDFLRHAGGGFGLLALTSLLDSAGLLVGPASAAAAPINPLAPKTPHIAARA